MKLLTAFILALVACGCVPGQTHEIKALGEQVARLLDYPAERIVITDESAKYVVKYKNQVIAIYRLRSIDDTFALVTIAIAKQGALVTPEMDAYWWKTSAIATDRRSPVRRFELEEGAYGYAGLGIAGPGGSEELVMVTWPTRKIDFQVKISFTREGVAYSTDTKAFYNLVCGVGPSLLTERLMKIVELLQSHVREAHLDLTGDR